MNTNDLLDWAFSHAANKQFYIALLICDQAIKQDPRNDQPYYVRGYIKHLSGKEFNAIIDLNKAINIHPHEEAYRIRGICKDNLGFREWAIKDYDKGLQFNPDDCEILICKASIYEREGEWEKALELYLKAVKAKCDSADLHFSISKLYLRLSQYDLAISSIKKAYRLEPLEEYKNFIQEIIKKSGYHPIHIFSNFFDGEIVEDIQNDS